MERGRQSRKTAPIGSNNPQKVSDILIEATIGLEVLPKKCSVLQEQHLLHYYTTRSSLKQWEQADRSHDYIRFGPHYVHQVFQNPSHRVGCFLVSLCLPVFFCCSERTCYVAHFEVQRISGSKLRSLTPLLQHMDIWFYCHVASCHPAPVGRVYTLWSHSLLKWFSAHTAAARMHPSL